MARDYFAFVPTDEVDDFVASHNGENDSQPLPPPPQLFPKFGAKKKSLRCSHSAPSKSQPRLHLKQLVPTGPEG